MEKKEIKIAENDGSYDKYLEKKKQIRESREMREKRKMSKDEMYKAVYLISLNNTYTEEEIYNILYNEGHIGKSIEEMYESITLEKLGKQQMILLGIQPAFPYSSPTLIHIKDIKKDIKEEREFHYFVESYYTPEKHDKWEQGDTLEMLILNRESISDKHNTRIKIYGEIKNISLEKRNTK